MLKKNVLQKISVGPFFWIMSVWLLLFITPGLAMADSPLTSTEFSIVYADDDLVIRALKQGTDERVLDALVSAEVPHDVRAAIVNALGWKLGGQNNAQTLLAFIAKKHSLPENELTLKMLKVEEAFALGYLRAMDNYLELSPINSKGEVAKATPAQLLEFAVKLAPKDFSVALIQGLIQSQEMMDESWCKVYMSIHDVVVKFPSEKERNFRPEALKIITEYIDLYKSECEHPRPIQGP